MKRKILFWSLIAVLAAAAVFSGYKFISLMLEYREGEKTYEELTKYVHLEGYTPQDGTPTEGAQQIGPYVDHEQLTALNPDFVGWIYIEGTQVNYPIVQGEDNDYYLHRMFNKEYNAAGSIFVDSGNSANLTDYNTVLYGHNMKNGSMFADVESYRSQGHYDAHPTGLLLTADGNYELQFFAGYAAKTDSRAWELDFATPDSYEKWLQQAVSQSFFKSSVTPTASDRVVTLSTCTYDRTNARFVLLAVLKPLDQ